MQTIPLKDLKKNLASIASKVSKGKEFLVTKHNRPYFIISPPTQDKRSQDPREVYKNDPTVHIGDLVGKGKLTPLKGISQEMGKKILEYFWEDRADDR